MERRQGDGDGGLFPEIETFLLAQGEPLSARPRFLRLITMAAPRRKSVPVRPATTPDVTAPPMAGGIVAGSAPDPGTITMVRPNQAYNKDDLFLMKLSQIVMMGIGFLSIWYGVFAVAFDDSKKSASLQ